MKKSAQHNPVTLAVAPMEGVMDHTMRGLLSSIGGMDYLVSEFVRVTQYPIPTSTFQHLVPENKNKAQTEHQHPVHTQLLGNNAELMAESAANAIEAGATHIDINFGCPAKRVNGHGGGSVLLQDPNTLHTIMKTIRNELPESIPVSAKIRLGYEDEALLFDNVAAIEAAGTNKLTVHGRTKKDGYKPPARWEKIGEIQNRTKMLVVANGDITDITSLLKCQSISGCNHFMIGRGSLNNPFVFQDILAELNGETRNKQEHELFNLFSIYTMKLQEKYDEVATLGRLKQWCGHLRFEHASIRDNLTTLRRSNSVIELLRNIEIVLKG
ncbi:tRNA-dihydrouridine synthase family protein [Marinomonas sp. GJ51-6]|uniref:tRNA dihydrouridine synthase n=1 Tax=Marinomonas sp. GJ51-6 TaxID=2992802 RepID=UPI0029347280|nr:tRNA-dihydrouridine synthase family protein [Marinomonas sp. GJ51-6]WOD08347.1 tRNA-dihydrouridine synthase family protein [Marinomonas sp. GJ51-6]